MPTELAVIVEAPGVDHLGAMFADESATVSRPDLTKLAGKVEQDTSRLQRKVCKNVEV